MKKAEFLYPMRDSDRPEHVILIPCSEEVYRAVMPEIWRGIKQMKARGMCDCPKRKTGFCDLDCGFCEYRIDGSMRSLDAPIFDEDEITLGDSIEDESAAPDVFIEKLTVKMELCKMSRADYQLLIAMSLCDSEREAARMLNIPRSTFKRRLKTAQKRARTILGDIPQK